MRARHSEQKLSNGGKRVLLVSACTHTASHAAKPHTELLHRIKSLHLKCTTRTYAENQLKIWTAKANKNTIKYKQHPSKNVQACFLDFIYALLIFSEVWGCWRSDSTAPPRKTCSLTFLLNSQIKANLICHIWWEKALQKLGAEHFCQNTLHDMMNYQ